MARYTPQKTHLNSYPRENPYYTKHKNIPLPEEKFNGILVEYGIRVLHEKVTLCPNYVGNIDSNYHELNCNLCENSFVHFDPQEMWGIYEQHQLVKSFFMQGVWDKGVAVMTFPTHAEGDPSHKYFFDYFDRITILDFEERFYEVINKSVGDKDILRYEALDVNFLRTSRTIYEFHRDFEIDDDGNIVWLTNSRPSYDPVQQIGEVFTVSYLRRPVYRVVELLHEGRYSQQAFKQKNRTTHRLPQQVMIKKDFLIDKADTSRDPRVTPVVGGVPTLP